MPLLEVGRRQLCGRRVSRLDPPRHLADARKTIGLKMLCKTGDTFGEKRPPMNTLKSFCCGVAAVLLLTVGFESGCGWPQTAPSVKNLTPDEAAALIQTHAGDADFVILDVRNPEEFATGHLQNAVNVCYLCPDFADSIAALDKSRTYLVYCGTEHRSPLAAADMISAGFTHVYNLSGGLVTWRSQGHAVVM